MTLTARLSAWARSPEGLLCLGLWILFGMLINDYDLESFNLQQMGIEAIVERGHLYVDGSPTPQLQPRGDVFLHDGHLYAAKQPGEFFAGALVYAVLHALGLSYVSNFLITSALVTFFTASLATAVTAACVYRLARAWASPAASPLWPWLAALAFGVGSTALPYAGVTHHAVQRDRVVTTHPDTGLPVVGMKVPYWDEVLRMSRRVAEAVGLGYVGVDIVVDEEEGPLLLEANARPGLAIQIANGRGLLPRLEEIDALLDRPALLPLGHVGRIRRAGEGVRKSA